MDENAIVLLNDEENMEDNAIKILGRVLPESGKEHQKQEVYDVDGCSPSILAADYKDPKRIVEEKPELKFLGNIYGYGTGFDGSVFDENGVAPSVVAQGRNGGMILENQNEQRFIDVYNHKDITDKGTSGTITTNCVMGQCGVFAVVEPIIAASRGRNLDNPSDRSKGSATEQRLEIGGPVSNTLTTVQKDNLLIEPACLRYERTEECKKKRRETKDKGMGFKDGKYLAPRSDGLTNTLTTIDKDNMIIEPKKIVVGNLSNGHEANDVLDPEGIMKTVMENHGKPGYITEDKIPIKSAVKSGYELAGDGDYIDLQYPNSETRRGKVQEQVAGTLCCTDQQGTIEIKQPNFRIRKLTETECMRLMGVKDADSERVHQHQSKSSMYHLAGDSIVTAVLMAIFGELFGVEWKEKIKYLQYDLTKESRDERIS